MNLRVEGKQKRAQATRAHILQCFADLMARHDYDDISVAQIAASANVGKGTVLAHFSEKLALAATQFADVLNICLARIEAESEITNAAQLRTIFDPFFDLIRRDEVYIRLIVGEGQDICRQLIEPAENQLFDALGKKWPHGNDNDVLDIVALRAFLVHAAVAQRACERDEAVMAEFEALVARYLFKK
ncbi:TetR/AcrR family transcriptional regulator [Maritalea mediterranea]|uniref:TetR/AcrR family transcriptional regulator n=1 Tax=Maritalea mediterranea TaxID=2909667 RepID=A0ABS9E4Q6_9HYPH|nr:TetR/AcrR family transcriptional regulator [Maritalea mediterranea]MCF4096869.1 TetR/AcrR family transcriptional regulator [Maritalea mediterranea]